jgi:signal transduction histidine kinase
MTAPSRALARRYAAALHGFLDKGNEGALHEAYELGRAALADGVSLLDLALLHHEALAGLPVGTPVRTALARTEPAALFFAETLSPFEMTLLGFREANQRLGAANEELARANREIESAHARLLAETAERERAEEALRQAQRLQAIGQLSGGIAHHFNNLLTVVLGNLHMAQRRVTGDEKLERLLGSATLGAERGAAVTKQLLAFSRRQMLKPEVLDTSQALAQSVALLSGALSGEVAIESEIAEGLPPIEIDPTELDLALLNLALNAKDAMPGGGVLKVSADKRRVNNRRLQVSGARLVIEVADTGVGIAPDQLPLVFDPFFTTKGAAGTGLGLSQVYGFAHQSGGAVDIDSAPGKGTRVRLILPLAPGATLAGPAPAESEATSTAVGQRATVLVVDDDEEVANLAAALLEEAGFRVKLAHRARAALDIVRRDKGVDLLFSDIVMPDGMDGIALAEAVRKLRPALPILLTSGYSDALADGRAETRGFPILPKPYKAAELRRGVLTLLDNR